MNQAEMEKAAHEFVQRLQVRADPWEVSEKALVELFTKFALAQREEAVQKCAELAKNPYSDEVQVIGREEPFAVGAKIVRAIREAFPECFPEEKR